MEEKQYTGSCYIAVTESITEDGRCRDSIEKIIRRPKDGAPQFHRYTKGYEARQAHLNNWYEKTKHPFILFLDGDMMFEPETLERLRRHKKAFVSGIYLRRQVQPLAPLWFEQNEPGKMPLPPLMASLPDNTLFKIGASGWGCILLHRDVVTAMKLILKGEPEIIEDDMDVFPYDLKRVMLAIDNIQTDPINSQAILREEIKPLRGLRDSVGSDVRFPFYARLAGFDLWGDTGVQCKHIYPYPLEVGDYNSQAAAVVRDMVLMSRGETNKEIERIKKATAL